MAQPSQTPAVESSFSSITERHSENEGRTVIRPFQIAIGIVAVALLAACVPIEAEQDSLEVLPAKHTGAVGENIANKGRISVSAGDWNLFKAIDGDLETWWSSDGFAPQWLAIRYDEPYLVNRVEFSVSQVNDGPSTHEVWLKSESGISTLAKGFINVYTADRDLFAVVIDPPQRVAEVRIITRQGQGWIALREVQIFASLSKSSSHSESDLAIPEQKAQTSLLHLKADLINPVQLTHTGDGSGRLLVVEKTGRIRIIKDDELVETPFLDIEEKVLETHSEQGLFNIAFPPSYPSSQRFYVSYTDTQGDTVISRFATSANPDRADPDSEEIILILRQMGASHNGGTLSFGPRDGYLYIASGDGLETNPSMMPQHVQDPGSLLGKLLRIDVESGASPYAIPPDNPFASTPGYAPEIWAMGLRNSWGMSFDERTGDLFIPDTGWITSEEINFQPANSPGGENYGWPMWEGILPAANIEDAIDVLVWPVAVYGRDQGCAVVGGAMHEGAYVYADFCIGRVWALRRQGEHEWKSEYLVTIGVPISSIDSDESGNLYATGFADGKIYKLDLRW